MIDSQVLSVYYRVYSGETWRSILPVSPHEGSDHELYPVGSAVKQKIMYPGSNSSALATNNL